MEWQWSGRRCRRWIRLHRRGLEVYFLRSAYWTLKDFLAVHPDRQRCLRNHHPRDNLRTATRPRQRLGLNHPRSNPQSEQPFHQPPHLSLSHPPHLVLLGVNSQRGSSLRLPALLLLLVSTPQGALPHRQAKPQPKAIHLRASLPFSRVLLRPRVLSRRTLLQAILVQFPL